MKSKAGAVTYTREGLERLAENTAAQEAREHRVPGTVHILDYAVKVSSTGVDLIVTYAVGKVGKTAYTVVRAL